jgi:hypothetical protein
MNAYFYRAYLPEGPEEPLLKGTIIASSTREAMRKVEETVREWAAVHPEAVFTQPPDIGPRQAARPEAVVLMISQLGKRRKPKLQCIYINHPRPHCTGGGDHEWRAYGTNPYARCCSRCGLVEYPVEGGRAFWYLTPKDLEVLR